MKSSRYILECAAVAGLFLTVPVIGSAQIVRSMSNIFGGYDFYDNTGVAVRSMSNIFGGYDYQRFRGAEASALFADAEFAQHFPEEAWIDAVEHRDVEGMTTGAWALKKVEIILGRTDKKTSSSILFDAAARVAVGQNNEEALRQIIALAPECVKYRDELKAAGTTRGLKVRPPMLQVVYPQFDEVAPDARSQDLLKNLRQQLLPHQTPYLNSDMVCMNFRGVSATVAENVALLVNRGRLSNDPKLLVQAAIAVAELAEEGETDLLDPMSLLTEAAELAVALEDRTALALAVDVLGSEAYGLKSEERAQAYREELKLLGASRGQSSLMQHVYRPGWRPRVLMLPGCDMQAPFVPQLR